MVQDKKIATLLFFVYLGTLVLISSVHSIFLYGVLFFLALILSGRTTLHILKHTIRAVVVVNLVVTGTYFFLNYSRDPSGTIRTVFLINARVGLMTWVTFLLIHRVNVFRALSFEKTIQFFFVLGYSQYLLYRNLVEEFTLAGKSRTPNNFKMVERYRVLFASGMYLFERGLSDAKEKGLAMKSRGLFHEQEDEHQK